MRKVLLITAAITTLAIASPVMASGDDVNCKNPTDKWLAKEEIKSKAEEQGYDVRRIKREDGCYEVYAINNKDERVEIYMNPATAEIVKIEVED